jgi:hypothetical protein
MTHSINKNRSLALRDPGHGSDSKNRSLSTEAIIKLKVLEFTSNRPVGQMTPIRDFPR